MFATFSGILLDPGNISEKDINLIDIAHHLTNINRYGGALPFDLHYSVAEHSILIAEQCLKIGNREAARRAILHDATEAYLGDIIAGLKPYITEYKTLEKNLEKIIFKKYKIKNRWGDLVNNLDKRIVLNEAKSLIPHHYRLFRSAPRHFGLKSLRIKNLAINDDDYGEYRPGCVPKQVVYEKFLSMCEELSIND